MQTLRQLVSGTDFSACAADALEQAIALALAASARVTLVHVQEHGDDELDDRLLLQCQAALSELVSRHRRRGVELTGVLRRGKPWAKLDNVAAEVGASLIVVGRHGAGRGRSLDLGSVAAHLVRAANRPVLVVGCGCDPDRHPAEPQEANTSP
ncbi:MAG: universal stress protein [Deltaproteobacteria bacterium]|nr:universal stress protein [Deltaproteobacteria bacterium]